MALDGVSFDVRAGEFIGITGPNGSGKSSMLKVLASIYAADSGSVRMAGKVAPFIELGAGFNEELRAFDNVVLSGVLMGLDPAEAEARFPDVIAFAGLEEFTELKLKNYSSGMRVRLAFSVMAQVDADILLVDEVLAVGDAEFQQKCLARLHELKAAGKTIVLVTHAMDALVAHCDRAILLERGSIAADGDPAAVAARYAETASHPTPRSGAGNGTQPPQRLDAAPADAPARRRSDGGRSIRRDPRVESHRRRIRARSGRHARRRRGVRGGRPASRAG